ncbi:MAG: radical SAM protein [Thermodesulfobacteriota bacterium]
MPLIIPVFIPHQGCPQHCLFCNQVSISGQSAEQEDDGERTLRIIREWLARSRHRRKVQVAFYGGSFTCLPKSRQTRFLAAVQPFIQSGEVDSIRLSTRPDCVDEEVCDFLKDYKVETVELGVQSFDDHVLEASLRGHSREDAVRAARLVKEKGLDLGIQLMVGLPGQGSRSWLKSLGEVVALAPRFVRIYPTLVIAGSGLAAAYRKGHFQPMSMNRAIASCCRAKEIFHREGIRIVRMGLQPSEELEKELLAGPYHPAFGELVAARLWFRRARRLLAVCPVEKTVKISISDRDLSAFVGPKRVNMKRLQELADRGNRKMKLETDKEIPRGIINHVIA